MSPLYTIMHGHSTLYFITFLLQSRPLILIWKHFSGSPGDHSINCACNCYNNNSAELYDIISSLKYYTLESF